MKAIVKKAFLDKSTRQHHAAKSEWSGTQARFEEINSHKLGPFLSEVEVKEAKPKTETKERKLKTETK